MCRLTEQRLNGFWCYKIFQVSCAALQCFFCFFVFCFCFCFVFYLYPCSFYSSEIPVRCLFFSFFLWKVIFFRSLNHVIHFSVVVVYSFSPVMSWTKDHELILCREVANVNPYMTKKGTTQRSSIWEKLRTL